MMFDDQKLKFNVNVQGNFRELAEYERSRKMKRSNWNKILFVGGVCFIGAFAMLLIHSAFMLPPTPSTFWHDFTQIAVTSTNLSWSQFAKFFLVLMMPVIAISWVFHGVQARLLA